jgi:porphobilinogen synthase
MSLTTGPQPLVATPSHPGRERPRRLRRTAALRALVRETRPAKDALMMPHFVLPVDRGVEPVASMPGIDRYGIEDLLSRVEKDLALGVRSVLLFGVCPKDAKDDRGSEAWNPEAAVPRAVRTLKRTFGSDLLVVTDVCLCAYTSHGHCGWLQEGEVDNDSSLAGLASEAVCHADAGADVVAPSDMMDGRVLAIRDALDARGHENVAILSYAVKYASAYYGPFRDAADSAPGHGDRKSYQMDPANVREAVREAQMDEAEGADLLMVKPALAYLDVIRAVREATQLPLAAYNVSGEYSQVKAAAERGWIDEGRVVHENLTAMVRAGADVLITYHAREALEKGWLT